MRSGTQSHILHKRIDALRHDTVFAHRLKEPLTAEETQKMGEFLQEAHHQGAEYDYAQVRTLKNTDSNPTCNLYR